MSTKPHVPWKLIWYCAFETEKQAKDFELYLKSGAGKAFAYKRLVSVRPYCAANERCYEALAKYTLPPSTSATSVLATYRTPTVTNFRFNKLLAWYNYLYEKNYGP